MQQYVEEPVNTFTIGFEDARYDERRYAQLAADAFGTRHRTRMADARDTGLLRRLLRHYGEPFADSSMLPTALLSEFTREHVTVALSGDGGDEVFGGYRRYQAMLLYERLALLPQSLRRAIAGTLLAVLPRARCQKTGLMEIRRALTAMQLPALSAYGSFQCIFSPDARAALMSSAEDEVAPYTDAWEAWMRDATSADGAEGFMELDLTTYLPDDLLCKVDIASMMHSLEVRSPFMDHALIEFVARLPRRYKVTHRNRKRILAAAVEDLLPPAIRLRGKQGFGVPIGTWLRQELADDVREMVFWQHEWDPDGLFDANELRRLAEEHVAGVADHSFRLWALLCLRLWTEEILRPGAH
jgi:asparagine synthase (glutamine-hydrolysing)